MKPAKREWLLNVAFILYWVFNFSQQAFLLGAEVSLQQRTQVYTFHNLGMVFGAFLLPLLLPIGMVQGKTNQRLENQRFIIRRPRYALRLAVAGAFFLPNIIVRLLGPQAWLASSFNTAFMAIGNGAVAALLLGCFINLSGEKKALWYSLAYSLGYTLYNFVVGGPPHYRELLLPLMFPAAGVFLTCAGVLILVFLAGIEPPFHGADAQDEADSEAGGGGSLTPIPDAQINTEGFNFQCILPVFAALFIFWTNSLTDSLFFPTLNIHFPPGFHPTVIVLILALPVLGFLASSWHRQFLIVFVPVSSFLFLFIPSLLFFSHSAPLFLVLYTLNLIMIQMMTQFFPIVIVDLYWQKKTGGRGHKAANWAWLLAVAIYMIRAVSFSMAGPFKQLSLDNAYAVILLSLAAVAYFLLSRKCIGGMKPAASLMPVENAAKSAAAPGVGSVATPVKSLEDSFKEHGLSEREAEVALLMAQEGLSTKEMGERLFISPLTVRDHTTSIYRKFGVKGKSEFMAKIFKTNLP